MNPLDALIPIALLATSFHCILQPQPDKLGDPAYLRREGVVVVAKEVLQSRSVPIGLYVGHVIWDSVAFMGMVYRYDHVLLPARKERLAPGEL